MCVVAFYVGLKLLPVALSLFCAFNVDASAGADDNSAAEEADYWYDYYKDGYDELFDIYYPSVDMLLVMIVVFDSNDGEEYVTLRWLLLANRLLVRPLPIALIPMTSIAISYTSYTRPHEPKPSAKAQ